MLVIGSSVEIELIEYEEYKAIPMNVASNALLLPFYLYLFIFPCVMAAGISGNCAGKIHIIGYSELPQASVGNPGISKFGFDFEFESG